MVENNGGAHGVADDDSSIERRPYVAPRLQRLGSVRELTLGPTGSLQDGGTTEGPEDGNGRRRRR